MNAPKTMVLKVSLSVFFVGWKGHSLVADVRLPEWGSPDRCWKFWKFENYKYLAFSFFFFFWTACLKEHYTKSRKRSEWRLAESANREKRIDLSTARCVVFVRVHTLTLINSASVDFCGWIMRRDAAIKNSNWRFKAEIVFPNCSHGTSPQPKSLCVENVRWSSAQDRLVDHWCMMRIARRRSIGLAENWLADDIKELFRWNFVKCLLPISFLFFEQTKTLSQSYRNLAIFA